MRTDDELMDVWLDWQMNSLSWLSSWLRFDERLEQAAEAEVQALCENLWRKVA